ncbi:MAG: hypothetical protein A3E80_05190 [Chlamydiae bacterium RIFCSPHIGHO2_12_FULL_49_9]|nr:MAG: hypothetical protein A3E80_05190 [Chlamydiae bacterium RIFCSPHIGHO2_12_FULL_49_9]
MVDLLPFLYFITPIMVFFFGAAILFPKGVEMYLSWKENRKTSYLAAATCGFVLSLYMFSAVFFMIIRIFQNLQ